MKTPRFRIQMTRQGYSFIALCLAVGISGLNTGNNLLYLVFGMMLSFIILSGLLSNNTLSNIDVHSLFPSRVFANMIVSIRLELLNRKRFFPSYAISLNLSSQTILSKNKAFIVKILPQKRVSTIHQVTFQQRGRIALPNYRVETAYPFGFLKKYIFAQPSEEELMIYPELISMDSLFALSHQRLGDFLSNAKGGSINPYGIREYVMGDSVRHIHWKTSARLGKWMLKEFEQEKRKKISLALYLAPTTQSESIWKEKAISATASLAVILFSNGYEIDLSINNSVIEIKTTGFMDVYLTALALAAPPQTPIPHLLPAEQKDNTIILITDLNHIEGFSNHDTIIINRQQLTQLS